MEADVMSGLVSALESGHWTAVAGFTLMIVVFFLRKLYASSLHKKDADLLAAGLAIVVVIGTGLTLADNTWQSVVSVVLSALTVGAAAVGFWELVGARIRDEVALRRHHKAFLVEVKEHNAEEIVSASKESGEPEA